MWPCQCGLASRGVELMHCLDTAKRRPRGRNLCTKRGLMPRANTQPHMGPHLHPITVICSICPSSRTPAVYMVTLFVVVGKPFGPGVSKRQRRGRTHGSALVEFTSGKQCDVHPHIPGFKELKTRHLGVRKKGEGQSFTRPNITLA